MIKPAKEYPDAVVYTAAHHRAGKKYGMTENNSRHKPTVSIVGKTAK